MQILWSDVQKAYATRQIEHLETCINCPETVKQLFKSKRNLCEENLNYLFFMFEFNIMAIENFFLIVNSDKTWHFSYFICIKPSLSQFIVYNIYNIIRFNDKENIGKGMVKFP